MDLAGAADLVLATKSALEEYCTDSFWEKTYTYSERIAELHSIEISLFSQTRQRKLPKHFVWQSKCDKNIKCKFQVSKATSNSKVQHRQLKLSKVQRFSTSVQLKVSKVQRLCQLNCSKVQRSCQLNVSKVQRSYFLALVIYY